MPRVQIRASSTRPVVRAEGSGRLPASDLLGGYNCPRWLLARRRRRCAAQLPPRGCSEYRRRIRAAEQACWPFSLSDACRISARTRTGPGGVDLPFGMTAKVLLFKPGSAAAVFAEGVWRGVQERVVARPVEVLQLADQVGLGKVPRAHT